MTQHLWRMNKQPVKLILVVFTVVMLNLLLGSPLAWWPWVVVFALVLLLVASWALYIPIGWVIVVLADYWSPISLAFRVTQMGPLGRSAEQGRWPPDPLAVGSTITLRMGLTEPEWQTGFDQALARPAGMALYVCRQAGLLQLLFPGRETVFCWGEVRFDQVHIENEVAVDG